MQKDSLLHETHIRRTYAYLVALFHHRMLKYKADLRSLLYMALVMVTFAWLWTQGFNIFLYVFYLFLAVSVSVMAHNHNHINIWTNKPMNVLTDWWPFVKGRIFTLSFRLFIWIISSTSCKCFSCPITGEPTNKSLMFVCFAKYLLSTSNINLCPFSQYILPTNVITISSFFESKICFIDYCIRRVVLFYSVVYYN